MDEVKVTGVPAQTVVLPVLIEMVAVTAPDTDIFIVFEVAVADVTQVSEEVMVSDTWSRSTIVDVTYVALVSPETGLPFRFHW